MAVDPADLAWLRKMEDQPAEHDAPDLSALETTEAVLAYVVAMARQEGEDEADCVELVLRALDTPAPAVRASEAILRKLGYVAVADRMRKIAGKRKHGLAPLQ